MTIKQTSTYLAKIFLGFVCLSGPLLASEAVDGNLPKHIPVGSREQSQLEKVKIQEKRSELFQKISDRQDISGVEGVQLSDKEKEEALKGPGLSLQEKTPKATGKATYFTSHEGAFHHPIAVSLLGDSVELEDGSIWSVCSSDRYKTLDWFTGDLMIIVPNHDWFSVYNYRLINANTGANVRVNLALGPIYNGIFTHWILAIDYFNREICLEDGSVWKMSSLEGSVVNTWLPNDTVIIGINDGWLSGSNPNILINVNMNNYAIGNCIY